MIFQNFLFQTTQNHRNTGEENSIFTETGTQCISLEFVKWYIQCVSPKLIRCRDFKTCPKIF